MVLICGIPSEAPLAMVRKALDELGVPYVLFNQRNFARMHLSFEIGNGKVTGLLKVDAQTYRLEDFGGVYTRVMDDRLLPELRGQPADSPMQRYCRSLHDSLMHWCEVAPARVVNRTGPMGSNSSKPYQAQLIR
ncbi:MAG: glutathione synthase, partial [Chloroflexota bacterium]|nr:glutathione synthase [Chloroflexota bacterium]